MYMACILKEKSFVPNIHTIKGTENGFHLISTVMVLQKYFYKKRKIKNVKTKNIQVVVLINRCNTENKKI